MPLEPLGYRSKTAKGIPSFPNSGYPDRLCHAVCHALRLRFETRIGHRPCKLSGYPWAWIAHRQTIAWAPEQFFLAVLDCGRPGGARFGTWVSVGSYPTATSVPPIAWRW